MGYGERQEARGKRNEGGRRQEAGDSVRAGLKPAPTFQLFNSAPAGGQWGRSIFEGVSLKLVFLELMDRMNVPD